MATSSGGKRAENLYALKVSIANGPMSKTFIAKNPAVFRVIQVRGKHTLGQLHRAIFRAFDREDEHLYEFQLSKIPQDPEAARYVLPIEMEGDLMGTPPPAGDVSRTKIGSLNLKEGDHFFYWFDFGDDWWHEIRVIEIGKAAPGEKYPKIVERVGESPAQYIGWDEM